MAPQSNLTAKYDEERNRANEQSQLVYLQGQIDELRRLMRDQSNKYQWVVEQTRKIESSVGQIQGVVERHQEETNLTLERSRRDIIELRTEVANAIVKIDEGIKPMREMQAQIHQLAEARKQDREQVAPWFSRIEEAEQQFPTLHNQIKESEDRQRQLSMQLERLREADALATQEVRRVSEDLQVEKQNLRRQIVEVEQSAGEVHETIKHHVARIDRLEKLHQDLSLHTESLPGQISEVAGEIGDIKLEVKRVETAATDWFMLNQERLEEMRQQSNEKVSELYDLESQHMQQMTSWLERVDGWVRELEQRMNRGVSRLEASYQEHVARLNELERRELQSLRHVADALRETVETTERDQTRMRGPQAE